MPAEVELKLAVPPGALQAAAKLPWLRKLAAGPVNRETLISVYFDTPKLKLRRSGLTLRVRKNGRERLQTVKADGAASAGRNEWEYEIAGDGPDFKRAKHSALKPLITRKLKKSLRPVFKTAVHRTVMPLRIGESDLELALDRGAIAAGKSRAPISEIEIELKKGERRDLAQLAARLRKALPVAYEAQAKSERGYALRAGERHDPVSATPIALDRNMTTAQAFTAIGLACLHQVAANEAAVRRGESEGVHQMRVGLRRLRAAMSVFKDMVAGRETESIKTQLKWLTEQLGPARDFDVFVAEGVAPLRETGPAKAELKLLEADLSKKRDAGFEQAKAAVESERYRRVVLDTALWLIDGAWLRSGGASAAMRERPIGDFARDVMATRTRKILKKSRKLEKLDPRARHKLRIATKKLRYATAFFAGVLRGGKARKRFATKLKALQKTLGTLNDIAVHQKLTRPYVEPGPRARKRPQKAYAAGVLTGREQARTGACLAAATKARKGLAEAERFWG